VWCGVRHTDSFSSVLLRDRMDHGLRKILSPRCDEVSYDGQAAQAKNSPFGHGQYPIILLGNRGTRERTVNNLLRVIRR